MPESSRLCVVVLVVVGLGFAGWLGIVKGAVGVAREEGPCSLQIFLSNCQELCVI